MDQLKESASGLIMMKFPELRAQSGLRLISNSLIDIEMSSGKAKTVFLLELILKLF